MWNDYFSKRQPKSADISGLVLKLHNAKKYEHVIAVINAALLHDQAEPWMFPVLAATMKIVGRPQEAIERVLLSQVDFSGTDVASMLFSGAYLSRFGSDTQALKMYRQASQVNETRPEPYALGLKLARKLNDYDAIQWAATGILINVWTRDHRQLHKQAADAAQDAIVALKKQGRNDEAHAFERAMVEARKRDLTLKLIWSGIGDIDLIIEEPLGTLCSVNNPQSRGGGVLVHDGSGPNQSRCFEEYVCAMAVSGQYRVRVRHIWGNIVGKRARLQIIRYQGTPQETIKSFAVVIGPEDAQVRLALKHGRRVQRQVVPEQPKPVSRRSGRPSFPGLIGPLDDASLRSARKFVQSRRGRRAKVGFQPVVRMLSEGATMSALAVVSGDRRYVRLTVRPFISTITDVFTFSFINNGNPNGGGGQGQGGQGGGQGGGQAGN